jgi:tRNA(fMet)-specific endonuclease VapC
MGLTYLLDTNTCIDLIRGRSVRVLGRLKSLAPDDVAVSTITVSELEYGAHKSANPSRNRAALEKFLLPLEILSYDEAAAAAYGKLRAYLEALGTPIGPMDTLIAAHARSLELILVSNNTKEFKRVPDLCLVDWTV